jgi:hypothetical protein
MWLTTHGKERILGRTKMLTKDVLSILSAGAAVSLGSIDKREYLLFWSPPDQSAKIAVVSARRKKLITILKRNHGLPIGLAKVTEERERKAREALTSFLAKSQSPIPKARN